MRVVTRLTGLSADTIRAWERRYGAVAPRRTEGNTRRYNAEDVRRLTLLKDATARGHRIGDIATLSEADLLEISQKEEALVAGQTGGEEALLFPGQAFERLRSEYLEAIARFDTARAREILSRASAVFSPIDFVLEVVLPVMRETGDRWEAKTFTVAHEHLVSMQVRSLLETILRMTSPHAGAPRLIAAAPTGHRHEFGVLAGAMLAALRGFDVIYLGTEVPEPDLVEAVSSSGAGLVLLSVVYRGTDEESQELAASIERIAGATETWVGIAPDHPVATRLSSAAPFSSFRDFDIALTKLLT